MLKEIREINYYCFRNCRRGASISIGLYLLVFTIPLMPYDILYIFANKSIFFFLMERNYYDYRYLVENSTDFSDAYVGGILLQAGIVLISVLYAAYSFFVCEDKILVTDRIMTYLKFYAIALSIFILAIVISTKMTDFGITITGISWFEDNPLNNNRFRPQPMNSGVFVMTAMIFSAVFFTGIIVSQAAAILLFSRRVRFEDFLREFSERDRSL